MKKNTVADAPGGIAGSTTPAGRPVRDRNVAECERFAEENGFKGAVAGHFPDVPFHAPPTFKPEPSPSEMRLNAIPRRIVDRLRLLDPTYTRRYR